MNNTRTALLFSIVLTAPAIGCGVSVEADIPDIQVTQRGLAFDGVPVAGIDGSVSLTYTQAHGKLDLPEELDSEVKTLSVAIRAAGGVDDLSFIRHIRITMAPGSGGGAPIELGTYDAATATSKKGNGNENGNGNGNGKGEATASGTGSAKEITLTTLNPANVLDAWKTESALFTLEIAGTLPTTSWSADVIIHFAGSAKYKY
jgi:hypothetical protein